MIASPVGPFVYAGVKQATSDCSGGNCIYGYRVPGTGVLQAVTGSPFNANHSVPVAAAVDSGGNFLYVSCGPTTPAVVPFSINSTTGALTALTARTEPSFPYNLTVRPDGKFLYVLDYNLSRIWIYSIGNDGTLSPGIDPWVPTPVNPDTVIVDASGAFLYTSHGTKEILLYSIDPSSGNLTSQTSQATAHSVTGMTLVRFPL